jgi:DNA-binding MarR family transcriptional regulator
MVLAEYVEIGFNNGSFEPKVGMIDNLALIAVTHRAGQIAEALFDQAFARRDITARQAQLLQAIAQVEGCNQTNLVAATAIDRSTLSDICRRLARKGLITRRRSRKDTRAWIMRLTPEGEAVLRRAQAAAAQAARQAREQIAGIDQLRIMREAAE